MKTLAPIVVSAAIVAAIWGGRTLFEDMAVSHRSAPAATETNPAELEREIDRLSVRLTELHRVGLVL